jgi:hypothetical protein
VRWPDLLNTRTITNYVTPWSRVLPEKLICPKLLQKFPAFHETQSSSRYSQKPAACPYTQPYQSSLCPPPHPPNLSKIHFYIILPSTPVSSKWSPSLRFPH